MVQAPIGTTRVRASGVLSHPLASERGELPLLGPRQAAPLLFVDFVEQLIGDMIGGSPSHAHPCARSHSHACTLMRTLLRILTHTFTLLARPTNCLHACTLAPHTQVDKAQNVCNVVMPSSAPYGSKSPTGLAMSGVAMMGVTMTGRASVGPLPRPHVRVWAPRRSAHTPSPSFVE